MDKEIQLFKDAFYNKKGSNFQHVMQGMVDLVNDKVSRDGITRAVTTHYTDKRYLTNYADKTFEIGIEEVMVKDKPDGVYYDLITQLQRSIRIKEDAALMQMLGSIHGNKVGWSVLDNRFQCKGLSSLLDYVLISSDAYTETLTNCINFSKNVFAKDSKFKVKPQLGTIKPIKGSPTTLGIYNGHQEDGFAYDPLSGSKKLYALVKENIVMDSKLVVQTFEADKGTLDRKAIVVHLLSILIFDPQTTVLDLTKA